MEASKSNFFANIMTLFNIAEAKQHMITNWILNDNLSFRNNNDRKLVFNEPAGGEAGP